MKIQFWYNNKLRNGTISSIRNGYGNLVFDVIEDRLNYPKTFKVSGMSYVTTAQELPTDIPDSVSTKTLLTIVAGLLEVIEKRQAQQ